MELTLHDLSPGQHGIIQEVRGSGPLHQRLLEMGFVRGASIRAERTAPLGDPKVYALHGYRICLRQREAAQILLAPRA